MLVGKTLYLRQDQMRDIERRAKREGKSKSQVIRELIELGRKQSAHRVRTAWVFAGQNR